MVKTIVMTVPMNLIVSKTLDCVECGGGCRAGIMTIINKLTKISYAYTVNI